MGRNLSLHILAEINKEILQKCGNDIYLLSHSLSNKLLHMKQNMSKHVKSTWNPNAFYVIKYKFTMFKGFKIPSIKTSTNIR
jgi:hypothetical protein